MQKIDSRVIIAVTLVASFLVGVYIDSTFLNGPKMVTYNATINEQLMTITNLETQLNDLQSQYNSLQDTYDQLETLSTQQNDNMQIEIENLESQIESLINTIEDKDNTISDMQNQIDTLNTEYDILYERYISVYNPIEISFTVNNLKIRFTTTTDKYPGNTAISGAVNINYLDGRPFKGTYKLSLYKLYINSSSSSGEYNIDGTSVYVWNTPFVQGMGSYKLSILELKDTTGTEIASNTELRNEVIYLFMG